MNSQTQGERLAGVSRVLWTILVFTAAANTLVQFRGEVAVDESSFFYVGHAMHEGLRLYNDLWDHKTPGVYLYTWIFAGLPMWIPLARLVLLLGGAGASFLVVRALDPERKPTLLRVAVPFVALSGLPAFFGHAVLSTRLEGVLLGLAWAAALTVRRSEVWQRGSVRASLIAVGGGAAFSAAAICHPLAIIHGLPLLAAVCLRPDAEKLQARASMTIVGFALGAMAVAGLVYEWMKKAGIFAGFMDQAIGANKKIAGHKALEDTYNAFVQNAGVLMIAAYAVVAVLVYLLSKSWPRRSGVLFYCATAAFAYFEGASASKFFFHHYADFIFTFSTLFALCLPWLLERLQTISRGAANSMAVLAAVPLFVIALPHVLFEGLKGIKVKTPQAQMAGLLRDLPAGSYVWYGNEGADLYLSANVRPASSHFYVTVDELTAVPDLFNIVAADFQKTPPERIVLPASWVTEKTPNGDCPEPIRSYMSANNFVDYGSGPKNLQFFKPSP